MRPYVYPELKYPMRWPLLCASFAIVTFAIALLASCRHAPMRLSDEAYIWQRHWDPAVVSALLASSGDISAWHVLAAEIDAHGAWHIIAPDWAALASTHEPVTAVVRIDGQLAQWDEASLLAQVQAVSVAWHAHRIHLAGLEIDHDCATARLPAYAHFLAQLRRRLPPSDRLTVTALPAWLDSPALDAVLAQVDQAVLQVHAVQSPRLGLFDADRAASWMQAFARHTHGPWRVALPTYGTRVVWDRSGHMLALESEQPSLTPGDGASELLADPAAMEAFVKRIERQAPPQLAGIVWFRLPTERDARAWSLGTWLAVLRQLPLEARVNAVARASREPDLYDLLLANTGSDDALLPASIRIDSSCRIADGIDGYTLARDIHGMFLQRTQHGLLRAGQQRPIGWLRCGQEPLSLHVEP